MGEEGDEGAAMAVRVHGRAAYALLDLPPPPTRPATNREWAGISERDVRLAYLAKAKSLHPDKGGDADSFARLTSAMEYVLRDARISSGTSKDEASRVSTKMSRNGRSDRRNPPTSSHTSSSTTTSSSSSANHILRGDEARSKGNTHYMRDELDEALVKYTEAIMWCPTDARNYSNRAAVLLKMGRLKVSGKSIASYIYSGHGMGHIHETLSYQCCF